MAGITVKTKLKTDEKFTGYVEQVFEKAIVLQDKNERRWKLPVPEDVAQQVSEDYDGEIITIEVDGDGNYSIEQHDDFPEEKKK